MLATAFCLRRKFFSGSAKAQNRDQTISTKIVLSNINRKAELERKQNLQSTVLVKHVPGFAFTVSAKEHQKPVQTSVAGTSIIFIHKPVVATTGQII